MAYQDKIYDMVALEMFKRLEVFLDEWLGDKAKSLDVKDKIYEFAKYRGCAEIAEQMQHIRRCRNKIVHPKNLATILEFTPHPVPVLDLVSFKEYQKICFSIDNEIRREFDKELRMKEIMIPTLKYDMGNAGDIIKHGLLAEFVKWYTEEYDGKELRFADSFGGCPWGNLLPDSPVHKRLLELKNTALLEVYPQIPDKYYGSSHLVRKVAEKHGLTVRIDISDKDENARCNLENSIMGHDFMELIELPSDNDGYKILDDEKNPEQYNLILLDPYSKFLLEEYRNKNRRFKKIKKLVENNPHLFIAVFILDMEDNPVRWNFMEFKNNFLSKHAFSLRCPKLSGDTGIKGENVFDSEILLISQQIADGKCDTLKQHLINFTKAATNALPLQKDEKVNFKHE